VNKTVGRSPTFYTATSVRKSGVKELNPVNKRQNRIPGEYARNAKMADKKYNGWNKDDVELGDCAKKLQTKGKVLGLVAGAFGEGSEDLHNFIQFLAKSIASDSWEEMGFPNYAACKGTFTSVIYRDLGCIIAHGNAYLKNNRVGWAPAKTTPGGSHFDKEQSRIHNAVLNQRYCEQFAKVGMQAVR